MTEPLTKKQHESVVDRGWRWAEGLTEAQRDDPGLCLLATIDARDAEIERLRAELRDLSWRVVANAGRGGPRWVCVKRATGLCGARARALCDATGFDPDDDGCRDD